jgi:BlaI family penicillinase repressor
MVKKVSLTDSEWQIIKLLWDNAPLTITQMEKLLKGTTGWSRHTLISLLKRMMTKETITIEDDGKVKRFYPAISKDNAYLTETQSFLSKLYDGKIGLMISSMANNEELNEDEINELITILNKLKEGEESACSKS